MFHVQPKVPQRRFHTQLTMSLHLVTMWWPLMTAMPQSLLQLRGWVSVTKSCYWHCSLTIHHTSDTWVKKGLNLEVENDKPDGHQGKVSQGAQIFLAVVTVIEVLTTDKLWKQNWRHKNLPPSPLPLTCTQIDQAMIFTLQACQNSITAKSRLRPNVKPRGRLLRRRLGKPIWHEKSLSDWIYTKNAKTICSLPACLPWSKSGNAWMWTLIVTSALTSGRLTKLAWLRFRLGLWTESSRGCKAKSNGTYLMLYSTYLLFTAWVSAASG